jgi:hypothetical protein
MALPQLRLLGTLSISHCFGRIQDFYPGDGGCRTDESVSNPQGLDLSPESNMTSSELDR